MPSSATIRLGLGLKRSQASDSLSAQRDEPSGIPQHSSRVESKAVAETKQQRKIQSRSIEKEIEVKKDIKRQYLEAVVVAEDDSHLVSYYEIIEAVDGSGPMIIMLDLSTIGTKIFDSFKKDLEQEANAVMDELFAKQYPTQTRKKKEVEFNFIFHCPTNLIEKDIKQIGCWDCDESIFAEAESATVNQYIYISPGRLRKNLERITQDGMNAIVTSRYHDFDPSKKFTVPKIAANLGDYFKLIIFTHARLKHSAGIYLAVKYKVPFPAVFLVDDKTEQCDSFLLHGLPAIAVKPGSVDHLEEVEKRQNARAITPCLLRDDESYELLPRVTM